MLETILLLLMAAYGVRFAYAFIRASEEIETPDIFLNRQQE